MEIKKYKVCQKYASYSTKVEGSNLTIDEAIKLQKELLSKPRKKFVYYDIYLDN